MNERAQAMMLLKRARDILVARLAERVVESGDELIDDAQGLSYGGEIETLFDQLGSRLQNVSSMLAHLQTADDDATTHATVMDPTANGVDFAVEITFADTDPLALDSTEEKPTPTGQSPSQTNAESVAPQTSFQQFAQQLQSGDLHAAGRSLAELFDVDEALGRRCAETFHQRCQQRPDMFSRAMSLRQELRNGSVNNSLMLLWECFGLQGSESLGVMQTLRDRLAQASAAGE